MSELHCRSTDRRAEVRASERVTGIDDVDYLRYADDQGTDATQPQKPRLRVRLLGPAPEALLRPQAWRIEGGRRIAEVAVTGVRPVDDPEGDVVLELALAREGDASIYTLRIVGVGEAPPLPEVDPRYDRASLSFKLDCPSDLDCAAAAEPCEDDGVEPPRLDYLAKDYASFRQLLLERLSLTLPEWRERHVPDLGITLVELLAYVGDHLSYRQDVVATEAYLDTARLRTSVRRHARLVDYAMHDGVNARAWVAVCIDKDLRIAASSVTFYSRIDGWPDVVTAEQVATATTPFEVFRPVDQSATLTLYPELGRIRIYTWGGTECCLPRGTTGATLELAGRATGGGLPPVSTHVETPPPRRDAPLLAPGDVLILEEVLGPDTGKPEHADPSHRHAVRLTRVTPVVDPLAPARGLVEVEWMLEDALPFSLCLSSLDPAAECAPIEDVSVARGNVILVDHGAPVSDALPCVEAEPSTPTCEAPRRPALTETPTRRYRPVLTRRGLTFTTPVGTKVVATADGTVARVPLPASATLIQDPRAALPALALTALPCGTAEDPTRCVRCGGVIATVAIDPAPARVETDCPACGAPFGPAAWEAHRDLLDAGGDDPWFVVEVDDEGDAHLRFGDDVNGLAPEPGVRFDAAYRVGNGPAGNVASEAIAHVQLVGGGGGLSLRVRNPLPAAGGVAPEPVDDVRFLAPASLFSVRERAVTAEDYAELALRGHPELQRAAAALRWTGSWYEVEVGLDPLGGEALTPTVQATVEHDLERYRRIGHDLRVGPAHYVPVRVALRVCAKPEYLRGHVRVAIQRALFGRRGFFHPDAFTFGQALRLSALVAAVQAVEGVLAVAVTRLERLFIGDRGELAAGELTVGALEIVQLANDPALPEHGQLELLIGGGR